ncbi:cell division protein FtsQ/DivIB [Fodinibius salsisoli]|uniref:Cell division protein FtsQ/DivIB n=1 Tax=Fodinibius salsisoli TaxID=2820877 RepID=A0ABT3PNS9_9BACT|nr:cell division protein FtsQ/DivIB [Fodinibius salsisoli]MCW9707510.1 cell division protein FtsQ/DivIB [Fodinibius salsisoli]
MTKKKSNNTTKKSGSDISPLPWIAGALLILGCAVVAGFYWTSTMKVQEVYYEGNRLVAEEELRSIDIPTGTHPDSLNTLQIIEQFEAIPYIDQAAINVEPSGNVTIRITERQPIAMLAEGSRKAYVDKEGIRLPVTLGEGVNVPLVYGFSTRPIGDTLKSAGFKATADFLVQLRNKSVSDATISEVAWTDDGIVALTNQNGVKLIFGKEDFATRLRNWEAFYAKVIKQKGIESMRSIDMRFQGQIVTREKE